VHTEDHHRDARKPTHDLTRRFDAVQQGHADIENGDVGFERQRLPHRLASVARLRDDVPLGLLLENLPKSLSHDRVIVAQKDSQVTQ
jgi:hypothetical protein